MCFPFGEGVTWKLILDAGAVLQPAFVISDLNKLREIKVERGCGYRLETITPFLYGLGARKIGFKSIV